MEKDQPYLNFRKATICSGKEEKQTQLIEKQGKIPASPATIKTENSLRLIPDKSGQVVPHFPLHKK